MNSSPTATSIVAGRPAYRELDPASQAPLDSSTPALAMAAGSEKTRQPHSCYLAELARAHVIGDVTLVATADDLVLGGLQAFHGVDDPASHWAYRRRRFRRRKRLPGTSALLASAAGNNYFHWLYDSLPRLRLLELAGVQAERIDHFLLNELHQPFHEQSLTELGIAAHRRWHCSKGQVLEVERLLVPSMPAPPGVCPPWACEYLRRRFLPEKAPAASRRIYISRRQARGRKVQNEPEVMEILGLRGFEEVCLEQVEFNRQVALFASAVAVVAVHGAGLSNLVFAPLGRCCVLEMFSPEYINPCYRDLAATLRMPYQSLMGLSAGSHPKRSEVDDLRVEPRALREKLDRMGL
jgi:capsular polysaccharide biosynthesis protein